MERGPKVKKLAETEPKHNNNLTFKMAQGHTSRKWFYPECERQGSVCNMRDSNNPRLPITEYLGHKQAAHNQKSC